MILQEVLRLYPPIPMLIRGSVKPVKLGHLSIPAGVHTTLHVGLLLRDPRIWGDDANEFKPQRFSQGTSNAAAKIPSAFLSFSKNGRTLR